MTVSFILSLVLAGITVCALPYYCVLTYRSKSSVTLIYKMCLSALFLLAGVLMLCAAPVKRAGAFFLLAAGVWAKSLGATELYTGVSEADFSGYPDCREAFIKAQQRTLRLALEWPVRIVTPFMHMSKAKDWALAAGARTRVVSTAASMQDIRLFLIA